MKFGKDSPLPKDFLEAVTQFEKTGETDYDFESATKASPLKRDEEGRNFLECPVCMSDETDSGANYLIQCGHRSCLTCLEKLHPPYCPVCKTEIDTATRDYSAIGRIDGETTWRPSWTVLRVLRDNGDGTFEVEFECGSTGPVDRSELSKMDKDDNGLNLLDKFERSKSKNAGNRVAVARYLFGDREVGEESSSESSESEADPTLNARVSGALGRVAVRRSQRLRGGGDRDGDDEEEKDEDEEGEEEEEEEEEKKEEKDEDERDDEDE